MTVKAVRIFLFILFCAVCLGVWNLSGGKPSVAGSDNCSYNESAYTGLNLNSLEKELTTTGLIGRIHGAYPDGRLFVLSVREPDNFFSHVEFSLIGADGDTTKELSKSQRHDLVCIQGKFIRNPSPQKHIKVKSLEILESPMTKENLIPYRREVTLPDDLRNKNSFTGKVHAVAGDGKILVVEYQDGVIPIYIKSPDVSKDLYRGDIVEIGYRIQRKPGHPTHLQLESLQVLDSLVKWHGEEKELTGTLVKFSKSPQVQFDVYAMEVETQGVKRYFTLVNFEDEEVFKAIRNKLARIWDSHAETARSGRNVLINPAVRIRARGKINIVAKDQANPQILLTSPEDIDSVAKV
ncbi:MAG: hypothetical protein N5P05_001518 [Chroococcopsis gigantea SAG 12.99]|jgi:hypothetical protein|nr:hypothetical protein [Chlorogloea purpurea SAG 13.99]MDV2999912.1 hypothetical protein [Chroococcopsis gigantea SAG 12.99]